MAKNKVKKSKVGTEVPEEVAKTEEAIQIPPDIKHIRINLKGYLNISPTYSVSELTVQATHMKNDLGVSSKTPLVDEEYIATHHEFILECNINSDSDLDNFISNPIILTVYESIGNIDKELLVKLGKPPEPTKQGILAISVESAADLSEAFIGKATDKELLASGRGTSKTGSKKGSKKGSKQEDQKKGGKGKPSKETVTEKPSEMELPTEPVVVGIATVDLLPLFQGEKEMAETLIVHQMQKVYDDRIVPFNVMPRIVVQVKIDEDIWLPAEANSNIFSLTIESIYNLPNVMSEDKQYKVSTFIPSVFGKWQYVAIDGGKLKTKIEMENPKRWPGMLDGNTLCGATNYRLDEHAELIKNPIDVDLGVMNMELPRIEWNIIKRNYLSNEAVRGFTINLKKYRHLPIEVFITNASNTPGIEALDGKDVKGKSKSEVSSKSEKGKKSKDTDKGDKKDIGAYLHLMAIVDVSTLLYPGVNKCRIACPLNTYHELEILQRTGQSNSYFMPKVEEPAASAASPAKAKDSKGKGGGKSDKGSSKSKDSKGSKKGNKGGGDINKNDLKVLLPPPPPPPPEPSMPVYNESGKRTFIVLEIEFFKPLSPKRPIEDLSEELSSLLPKKPDMSKIVMTPQLADIYYKDVIKELTLDLIHQHKHFLKDKERCKCERPEDVDSQTAFLTYLQRSGVYHTYLTSITKAASVIVNEKFPHADEFNRNSKEYQNFIAEVYCFLIRQMNAVLNDLAISGAENSPTGSLMGLNSLLLYAKEASAIGAKLLADRYYLERIARDHKNAECWFDYAVFQLESGDDEKALECVKQALLIKGNHHYSLLLCGIVLLERDLPEEAETCLLSAVMEKQTWVEGWATMHLFYSHIGNQEGADLCLEMAKKYLNYPLHEPADYFRNVDDLAWTTRVCPDTIFFRTAVMLLKLRAFSFAEKALAHELIKKPGICHYYLAVIMYYRHNYTHALVHLQEAERIHGSDYAVASLTGHCYFALKKLNQAQEQYLRILESFDRPDDMHLLHVYLAIVWDRLGEKQPARKLLLLTCKHSPTPYTWLTAGILYYGQRDLISAEQCLTQANICDNRLPETWGYLALVNLELQRYTEAELCYKQAKKNKLNNGELEMKIQKAMKAAKEN